MSLAGKSLRVLAVISGIVLIGCNEKGTGPSNSDKDQKKIIEEIVDAKIDDLLNNHPERLLVALDQAMQQQQQKAARRVEAAATDMQSKFWESKLVIGNRDAKIRLAVFFDPLDPVSQKFREDVMVPIAKERSDVGFFMVPVSVYGPQDKGENSSSVLAAQAVIAATMQSPDKAIALWAKMPNFATQEVTKTVVMRLAKEVGLDVDKLVADMESAAVQDILITHGGWARSLGLPPHQLPAIFILKTDKTLDLLPPLIKDKMMLVLDAVSNGKLWQEVLKEELQKEAEKQMKQQNISPEEAPSKKAEEPSVSEISPIDGAEMEKKSLEDNAISEIPSSEEGSQALMNSMAQ